MEVYANFRQKVDVDPKEVIEGLIDKERTHKRSWFCEEGGDYYEKYDSGYGHYSFDETRGILKEKYEYIKALELVLEKLKQDDR